MTNFEKWLEATKHLFAPDIYRTVAWPFIVCAALQRRVWYGEIRADPLFCNLYITLVGPPAVGKGMIIGSIKGMLTAHKITLGDTDYDAVTNRVLLFHTAPDDITYEAFAKDMAECTRVFRHPSGTYCHASTIFCLEELGMLFKRGDNGEQLRKLLLALYDCKSTRYKTIKHGELTVQNPCVNMISAIQPETFGTLLDSGIVTDGFLSRMLLVYAFKSPRASFFMPKPGPQELKYREELLDYLLVLAKLYGEIKISQDAMDYLNDWFVNKHMPIMESVPLKMQHYMARKPEIIKKLMAGFHFGESTSMEISLQAARSAVELLDKVDSTMEVGLSTTGKSPLYRLEREIATWLKRKKIATVADIIGQFAPEASMSEVLEAINRMDLTGKIKKTGEIICMNN